MIKKYLFNLYFFAGAFYQLTIGILIFILGSFPRITHIDLLYWPPIFVFSLENYFFWRSIGILIMIYSIGTIVIYLILNKICKLNCFYIITKIFSIIQIFFIPFGTIYGFYELLIIDQIEYKEIRSKNGNEHEIEHFSLEKEVGYITALTAVYRLTVLFVLYLISIYISAMMLDQTYPIITMSKITKFRIILLSYAIFSGFQIIYGSLLVGKIDHHILIILGYFFGAIQIILIPFGTYSAIILFKNLSKLMKFKKKSK